MSRVGKVPISLPDNVEAKVDGRKITVKGPKGSMERNIPREVKVEVKDSEIQVDAKGDKKRHRQMHGTIRAIISNMVEGVVNGWSKTLELVGTGYRAEVSGDILTLTVGYSHPIKVEAPDGIDFEVEKTEVTVKGTDKELVGQIAAKIRSIRPPEPYKGKGIKYKDEIVSRKPGKAAKAQGAGATQ